MVVALLSGTGLPDAALSSGECEWLVSCLFVAPHSSGDAVGELVFVGSSGFASGLAFAGFLGEAMAWGWLRYWVTDAMCSPELIRLLPVKSSRCQSGSPVPSPEDRAMAPAAAPASELGARGRIADLA